MIKIIMYSDSTLLLGLCIPLTQTTESPLQSKFSLIKEARERNRVGDVLCEPCKYNLADDSTETERQGEALGLIVPMYFFRPEDQSWDPQDEQGMKIMGCRLATNNDKIRLIGYVLKSKI